MRLLITGASGLLGLNLAHEVAQENQVFGVVNEHPIHSDAFEIIQADLLTTGGLKRVFQLSRPEGVIHCAALADVDRCEQHPKKARALNADLPGRLAVKARDWDAKLIHISTDAVFDGKDGNYTEKDQPRPINVYGQTKLAGERNVISAFPTAIIARVNFFGWSPEGRKGLTEFFLRNLQQGNEITGYTDAIFNPLLANDLAGILVRLLKDDISGVYHVGAWDAMSKYRFGVELAKRFGLDPHLIRPGKLEDARVEAERGLNLSLNVGKLSDELSSSIPKLSTEIDRLYTLYQQGYPQKLRTLYAKDVRGVS